MSPRSEMRFIKALTNNKPFMRAKDVEASLNKAKKVILKRQCDSTDLKLEAEIRICEIRKIQALEMI